VDQAGEAVIGVVGRQHACLVSLCQELLGKRFDMTSNSPRIRR
jgi:hypothetical protein